ncbi:ALP1-like protein isoform X1 [Tanacetum coccineum]
MTSAMVEDEVRRWVKGEARRTELGTARRVREVRWVMSAATVVVERREEKSERSGHVMQLINEDQQMQGESSRRSRKAINRDRDIVEARLMADYFGPSPKYPDYYFRRRYRMNRSLFLEIVQGMPGSIDCMHWEWINCPKAWHGQFGRGYKKYPTIMLEAVTSYDLWIWHAFFGVAGANNDLTVLNHSPLFDDLLDDIASVVPYEVNEVTFEKGYYLADGIYL